MGVIKHKDFMFGTGKQIWAVNFLVCSASLLHFFVLALCFCLNYMLELGSSSFWLMGPAGGDGPFVVLSDPPQILKPTVGCGCRWAMWLWLGSELPLGSLCFWKLLCKRAEGSIFPCSFSGMYCKRLVATRVVMLTKCLILFEPRHANCLFCCLSHPWILAK